MALLTYFPISPQPLARLLALSETQSAFDIAYHISKLIYVLPLRDTRSVGISFLGCFFRVMSTKLKTCDKQTTSRDMIDSLAEELDEICARMKRTTSSQSKFEKLAKKLSPCFKVSYIEKPYCKKLSSKFLVSFRNLQNTFSLF